ncbi:MAG TPA: MauE/DoxX family redox-associated membrane protein [Pyrinomonadaceae bacterium]|jgi:hypothetical protein|nr:MauE/DoxX family redox-associated membrane protein [Pyrinomonadaceae bacterium]
MLKFLVHLSRLALVALFLFTAGAKILTARGFAENVSNLVGQRWAWPVTVCVIAAELLAAALLIWPRTVRAGAVWSAVLLLGFAGYALYYVYVLHGEPLECGCFGGIIASQLGVKTALRNLALLIPALLVIFGLPRLRRKEQAIPDQPDVYLTI